jgi:hypothetical protein
MNTANMPGFTAKASLYKTGASYCMISSRDTALSKQAVTPALPVSDLPGASCGKDPVFGNVICVECTPGPFPTCKTYVCDKSGNNCKETLRINTQLLTAWRTDTASLFALVS